MLELIETIAAASGSIPVRRRLDAGAFEKPCDPSLDRRSQLDLSAVDEQRNLPDAEHPDERFPRSASNRRSEHGLTSAGGCARCRQRAICVSSRSVSVTARFLDRFRHPARHRELERSSQQPRELGPTRGEPRTASPPGHYGPRDAAWLRQPPVLVARASFLAASSIGAMTSGRLMVTTFGMGVPRHIFINDVRNLEKRARPPLIAVARCGS